jgi:hypothetical protein
VRDPDREIGSAIGVSAHVRDFALRFKLRGQPGVVLAGPVTSGVCRVGDQLSLLGTSDVFQAMCPGVEWLHWGGHCFAYWPGGDDEAVSITAEWFARMTDGS